MQTGIESYGTIRDPLDNWPVRVPVHNDKIVDPFVVDEVGTDVLEGIIWQERRCRWDACLGWCHTDTVGALASYGIDGRCDSSPEDGGLSSSQHGGDSLMCRV